MVVFKNGILLTTTVLMLTQSATAQEVPIPPQCLEREKAITPDLSKISGVSNFSESLKTEYGDLSLERIEYSFVPHDESRPGRKQRWSVQTDESITIGFREVISGLQTEGYQKAKEGENCNTVIYPHSFQMLPQADGSLRGGFSLDTTFRGCTIFDRPCIRDGYKLTMCRERWVYDIDSHTFGVNIKLDPVFPSEDEVKAALLRAASEQDQIQGDPQSIADSVYLDASAFPEIEEAANGFICGNDQISGGQPGLVEADRVVLCGSSEFDERGFNVHSPVRNFFLNLIGVVTFNIGSKFVLDNVRSKLSDVHNRVNNAFGKALPSPNLFGAVQEFASFSESMSLAGSRTGFQIDDASNEVVFQHVRTTGKERALPSPTFCESVRPILAQYGSLLRSTTEGDKVINVSENMSLWNISENVYGSGYYFPVLLRPNGKPFDRAGELEIGEQVSVPAMHKIFEPSGRRVVRGDSLWGISDETIGDGSGYQEIYEQNREYLENADKIYPIQLLDLQK